MDISVFLAKLIGLYLLITALICLLHRSQIKITAKDLVSSRAALAVSAEISLIFGLVVAIDHSIWEPSWRGLITLLGYLMILKGIMRFAFPEKVKAMMTKMTDRGYTLVFVVMLIVGGYLTYMGFMQ